MPALGGWRLKSLVVEGGNPSARGVRATINQRLEEEMKMKKRVLLFLVGLAVCVLPLAAQAQMRATTPLGASYAVQGGTLANTADYDWWYGCSPTSAGMMNTLSSRASAPESSRLRAQSVQAPELTQLRLAIMGTSI